MYFIENKRYGTTHVIATDEELIMYVLDDGIDWDKYMNDAISGTNNINNLTAKDIFSSFSKIGDEVMEFPKSVKFDLQKNILNIIANELESEITDHIYYIRSNANAYHQSKGDVKDKIKFHQQEIEKLLEQLDD